MSDATRAFIRTIWPMILGALAAMLVTAAARWLGYDLDSGLALSLVTVAAGAVIYKLGHVLERSDVALLRGIGHFLLSLGADLGQPVYIKPDPESSSTRFRS